MNSYPKLINPKRLSQEMLSGTISPVPGYQNRKPCLAVCNEKDMMLLAYHQHAEEHAHTNSWWNTSHLVQFCSKDGGYTWTNGKHINFPGNEAQLTMIQGILFGTCDKIMAQSVDQGETWTYCDMYKEYVEGKVADPHAGLWCSRVLENPDGSIFCIAATAGPEDRGYRFRSVDMGKTWEMDEIRMLGGPFFKAHFHCSNFCEIYPYFTPSGRLMATVRYEPSGVLRTDIPELYTDDSGSDIDSTMSTALIESKDGGLTWEVLRGLGYQSQHYTSVVYLNEHDFVVTYTVRTSYSKRPWPHMGVQAVLGREHEDGSIEVDFDHDIIVLNDKTPDYEVSVNGYGQTQVMPDGSLITPLSYHMIEDEEHDRMMQLDAIPYEYFEDMSRRIDSRYLVDGKIKSKENWDNMTLEWQREFVHVHGQLLRKEINPTEVVHWRIQKNEK